MLARTSRVGQGCRNLVVEVTTGGGSSLRSRSLKHNCDGGLTGDLQEGSGWVGRAEGRQHCCPALPTAARTQPDCRSSEISSGARKPRGLEICSFSLLGLR